MPDDVSREVDQLLKDREKYQHWLSRLEAEKGQAPERAYDRVRGDYQKRLDEVTAELRAHSEAVQDRLRLVEQTVARIEAERAAGAEELEEARLRRSVGEYRDDNEWTELENRLVASLQQMDSQLQSAQGEIGRLGEILALVQRAERPPPPPPPVEPAPPPVDVAPPPPRAAPPPSAPPPPAPEPAMAATPEPEPADDEGFLSLEELVLEDRAPEEFGIPPESAISSEPMAPMEPEATAPPSDLGPAEPGVGDELAFLESLSLGGGGGEGGGGGGETGTDSFSFLEQHGSGTPQTIICPHCSAANDPAEWYCTECGEELPAE